MVPKTDHSQDIKNLRDEVHIAAPTKKLVLQVAADLLEMHDRQSLSLDNWDSARRMIELLIEHPITENHV